MFGMIPFDHRDNNLFDMFDNFERSFFGSSAAGSSFRTDIRDEGDRFVLEAELPGFKKEDINVSVEEDVLTVTATRKEEKSDKDKKDGYLRRERSYGSITRSFDVSQVEADRITGSLEDGILTLQLPKRHKAERSVRKVELQ